MLLVAGAGSCGGLVSCCWRGQQVLVSSVDDEGTVTLWVECGKATGTAMSKGVRPNTREYTHSPSLSEFRI